MPGRRDFKFRDRVLNQKLIQLLESSRVPYQIDATETIVYDEKNEELIENALISSVRRSVFPSWQVLTCPEDDSDRYETYMSRNGVPFQEEFSNGERWFLIPSSFEPHSRDL